MSLINTMLRDLENRRASELGQRNWQREVRALPPARKPGINWSLRPLLLAIGVVLALVFAYLQFAPKLLTAAPEEVIPAAPPDQLAAPTPRPEIQAIQAIPRSTAKESRKMEAAPRLPRPEAGTEPLTDARQPNLRLLPPLPGAATQIRSPSEKPARPQAPVSAPSVMPDNGEPLAPQSAAERRRKGAPDQISKTQAVPTARERAEIEFRRGQTLASNGQSTEAVAAWQEALAADPRYAQPRQALVRTLIELRRTDEAMAILTEGLEAQPAQIGWALSLARLLVERKDLAGAAKVLARSQPHAGSSADYAGFQGHLDIRLGRFPTAEEHYLTATSLAESQGRWWFGLAQAREAAGRTGEAREDYRRALACGNMPPALVSLAEQKLR